MLFFCAVAAARAEEPLPPPTNLTESEGESLMGPRAPPPGKFRNDENKCVAVLSLMERRGSQKERKGCECCSDVAVRKVVVALENR